MNVAQLERRGNQAKAIRNLAEQFHPGSRKSLEGLSTDQLIGILNGYQEQSKMATAQANRQYMLAHANEMNAIGQWRDQQAQDAAGVGRGLAAYADVINRQGQPGVQPGDTSMLPSPLADALESVRGYGATPAGTDEEATAAAMKAGGGGRNATQMLDAITRYQAMRNKAGATGINERGAPDITTLHGIDVIFNKGTGQFQISPQSKADANLATQTGAAEARQEAQWFPEGTTFKEQNGNTIAVHPDGRTMYLGKTSAAAALNNLLGGAGTNTPTATAERVTVSKGGKWFTVPKAQLGQALKQGYTQVK